MRSASAALAARMPVAQWEAARRGPVQAPPAGCRPPAAAQMPTSPPHGAQGEVGTDAAGAADDPACCAGHRALRAQVAMSRQRVRAAAGASFSAISRKLELAEAREEARRARRSGGPCGSTRASRSQNSPERPAPRRHTSCCCAPRHPADRVGTRRRQMRVVMRMRVSRTSLAPPPAATNIRMILRCHHGRALRVGARVRRAACGWARPRQVQGRARRDVQAQFKSFAVRAPLASARSAGGSRRSATA